MVQPEEAVEMQIQRNAPKSIVVDKSRRVSDIESSSAVYKPLPTKKLAVPCYVEGCENQATMVCTAVGCLRNYGCGRGICEEHKSKRNVQYDRYTKPPAFCQ